jgi:multidrug transporter EmrE-like cation transporter
MKSYLGFILIFICGLFYTIGDVAMKKWITSPSIKMYLLGGSLYIIGMNFLAFSYKFKNIAIATAGCVIVNIILLTILSFLYFKEPLTTKQMIGLGFSLVAMTLLE